MEEKDLRIGNLVRYNGMDLCVMSIITPALRKPEKFNNKWCLDLLCDGIITCAIDETESIPLTEEWLIKLGFEKWGLWYVKNNFYLDLYKNMCVDKFILPYESPKYVHQLQNLYHSLTGQELTICQP